MRIEALLLALAVAGFGSSIAIAQGAASGEGRSTSTSVTQSGRRVEVCHRTASAQQSFRKISVSRSALEAHMRHGDLLAATGSSCQASATPSPTP
jgi:hypothetical protein